MLDACITVGHSVWHPSMLARHRAPAIQGRLPKIPSELVFIHAASAPHGPPAIPRRGSAPHVCRARQECPPSAVIGLILQSRGAPQHRARPFRLAGQSRELRDRVAGDVSCSLAQQQTSRGMGRAR